MRFLIGLIFGAAAILLMTGGTVPETPDEWRQGATVWLDRLAVAVGDALELPQGAEPAVETVAVPPVAKREAAAAAAAAAESKAATPEPARQPIPRPPDPLPVDEDPAAEPELELAWAADDVESPPLASGRDTAAAGPLHPQPDPRQPKPPAHQRLGDPHGSQAVWVPFHSEMSATGFAARLSESLDYPFEVQRQGPGRYQVVFAYADEAQRAELLDQAAAATGLPL